MNQLNQAVHSLDSDLRISQHASAKESIQAHLVLAILVVLISAFASSWLSRASDPKVPYVGHRSFFEPSLLVAWRYSWDAERFLSDGYRKFKDSMFKVTRNDSDLLLISNKYVDELRNLPTTKLSSTDALLKNMFSEHTALGPMGESDLHLELMAKCITPKLGAYAPAMREEVGLAFSDMMPDCEDYWAEIRPYPVLLGVITRVMNRILVGVPLCRDPAWLQVAIQYTDKCNAITQVLKRYPRLLRPIVAFFLPAAWGIHTTIRTARDIIAPILEDRRAMPRIEDVPDGLQWMMDHADAYEGSNQRLAHRLLLLNLAAVHSSAITVTQALYDVVARPEYFAVLRDEIQDALSTTSGDVKATYAKTWKLESFLKESQAFNPLSFITFQRIVKEPLNLADGTTIAAGTHIGVPAKEIQQETGRSDGSDFDGLRYYKRRCVPGQEHKYHFSMTNKDNIQFGHGKYACPGRFLAAQEIKMILASLLMEYDFRFPEGQNRPKNQSFDELQYPDPAARLLVRKRSSAMGQEEREKDEKES